MEINVCEKKKVVEIWLANAEKDGTDLSNLYARYSSRGYLVAVFESGEEDLVDLTAGLLIHNQKKLAT